MPFRSGRALRDDNRLFQPPRPESKGRLPHASEFQGQRARPGLNSKDSVPAHAPVSRAACLPAPRFPKQPICPHLSSTRRTDPTRERAARSRQPASVLYLRPRNPVAPWQCRPYVCERAPHQPASHMRTRSQPWAAQDQKKSKTTSHISLTHTPLTFLHIGLDLAE